MNRLAYTMMFMLLLCAQLNAQVVSRAKTILVNSNTFLDTIQMNGTLDGFNTYARLSKSDRWENQYYQFIPMKSIVINNRGTTTIVAPRLIINGERNWYDKNSILQEAIGGINIPMNKKTILQLWDFMKNGREHFYPSGWDDYSLRLLATYGYTMCDGVAGVVRFFSNDNGSDAYMYLMPHHTVAEVENSLVDSDMEVFYLGFDNENLVGVSDVVNDKYLISRTKHFGKNILYNKETDNQISLYYNDDQSRYNPEKSTKTSALLGDFDFILKPNESIHFLWDKASKYAHNWSGSPDLPDTFLEYFVSNSKHVLTTDFDSTTFESIFEESQNICLSQKQSNHPVLHASDKSAYFIYRENLPFPVLDAQLKGKFQSNSERDSISIYISLDGEYTWEKIWTSNKKGVFKDSVDVGQYFPYPLGDFPTIPLYNYSLKFVLSPTDSLPACGLDSLYVENTFQISKRFLPTLKLGTNTISYQDANAADTARKIAVSIEWQESWENKPPNKITAPTFPLHQAEVDSLYFAFTWQPATDDDGDEITDYEFMLSDDERMLYPHSPNFNLYVSAFDEEKIRPYFKVKETGWLNDGETYYWRVRAKDARGAWSEWSDTWSFTPHGVMRPTNGKAEIVGQSIKLSWERNPTGKQPDFYKIYASDEMNGFSPDASVFFAEADSTELTISFDKRTAPYSFYRIAACDTLGQESLISDVISIPYPYMYAAYDSVRVDSTFSMHLLSNERFYPFYYYGYGEDLYIPTVTIEQQPDWLSRNESNVLYSNDVMLAKKMLYMDSTQRSVLVSLNDEWGNSAKQRLLLHTTATNNKPMLALSDSIVCEDSAFSAYVTSIDADVAFGDTNHYTMLQKPAWLDFSIEGDTIYFAGIPKGDSINGLTRQDSLLRILAVDTKNDSTTVEYLLRITPVRLPTFVPKTPLLSDNCSIQVIRAEGSMYYAKVQAARDMTFRYNLYSASGMMLYSSNKQYVMGGGVIRNLQLI